MELGQLVRLELGQRGPDRVAADPRELLEEARAGFDERAFDDASVVGSMVSFDEPVTLDTRDEPGRRRRTEVEDLRDPAHRLRPFSFEQEEQTDLAERQVARERGRFLARHAVEDPKQVIGRRRQALLRIKWFSHPRIVHVDVN